MLFVEQVKLDDEAGGELGEGLAVDGRNCEVEDVRDAVRGGDIEEGEDVLEISVVRAHHIPLERGLALLSCVQSLDIVEEQVGVDDFSVGRAVHIVVTQEIAHVREISIQVRSKSCWERSSIISVALEIGVNPRELGY